MLKDLDQRAEMTVWPKGRPAHTAKSREFATLREALQAAAEAIDRHDARPWIITEAGDILSPRWIEAHTSKAPQDSGRSRSG